jgi:hypothetical protein
VTDGVEFAPSSLAQLRKLGEAYRAGEAELQTNLENALQAAARPLGPEVIRAGASRMPRTGGLQARVARARAKVTTITRGRTISVALSLANQQGDSLAGLDEGLLYHPVFGRWVGAPAQKVTARAFSKAFEAGRHRVEVDAAKAVQATASDIARKA